MIMFATNDSMKLAWQGHAFQRISRAVRLPENPRKKIHIRRRRRRRRSKEGGKKIFILRTYVCTYTVEAEQGGSVFKILYFAPS